MSSKDTLRESCSKVLEKFPQVANVYEGKWKDLIRYEEILNREDKVILHLATPEQRALLQAAVRQRLYNICDAARDNRVGKTKTYISPEKRGFQSFRLLWKIQGDLKNNKRAADILKELEEILKEMGIQVIGGILIIPEWARQ